MASTSLRGKTTGRLSTCHTRTLSINGLARSGSLPARRPNSASSLGSTCSSSTTSLHSSIPRWALHPPGSLYPVAGKSQHPQALDKLAARLRRSIEKSLSDFAGDWEHEMRPDLVELLCLSRDAAMRKRVLKSVSLLQKKCKDDGATAAGKVLTKFLPSLLTLERPKSPGQMACVTACSAIVSSTLPRPRCREIGAHMQTGHLLSRPHTR